MLVFIERNLVKRGFLFFAYYIWRDFPFIFGVLLFVDVDQYALASLQPKSSSGVCVELYYG